MLGILKTSLDMMSSVKKPQRTFIMALLSTLALFQGKATFRNLSRYSDSSEKRFSRWYRRAFDFVTLNWLTLEESLRSSKEEWIAALDASFIRKSGQKTDGLGMFYNGCAGKAERGLEISLLSLVNLSSNTAYALDARQTVDQKRKTRVDLYAGQVTSLANQLTERGIKYLAADAYYFKQKFVTPVVQAGLHVVSKLRNDAFLRWPYTGPYSGKGRPRTYGGKVVAEKSISTKSCIFSILSGIWSQVKRSILQWH